MIPYLLIFNLYFILNNKLHFIGKNYVLSIITKMLLSENWTYMINLYFNVLKIGSYKVLKNIYIYKKVKCDLDV